jgi:hypothetical protein
MKSWSAVPIYQLASLPPCEADSGTQRHPSLVVGEWRAPDAICASAAAETREGNRGPSFDCPRPLFQAEADQSARIPSPETGISWWVRPQRPPGHASAPYGHPALAPYPRSIVLIGDAFSAASTSTHLPPPGHRLLIPAEGRCGGRKEFPLSERRPPTCPQACANGGTALRTGAVRPAAASRVGQASGRPAGRRFARRHIRARPPPSQFVRNVIGLTPNYQG